ncbi:WecB/TagA/CpsF family glycosyltransferase [Salmonella enterica subsp. enterica]|nr:WecB/TagA/CpsF family glycosyltransferase [Salmonella enterica subsp. enterica]
MSAASLRDAAQTEAQNCGRSGTSALWVAGRLLLRPASGAICARIHASGAKIVTVAMGSPKAGITHARLSGSASPCTLYMGVGGTMMILFYRSRQTRPKNMAEHGGRWLYRLLSQPKRITRRSRCCLRCSFAGTIRWRSLILPF